MLPDFSGSSHCHLVLFSLEGEERGGNRWKFLGSLEPNSPDARALLGRSYAHSDLCVHSAQVLLFCSTWSLPACTSGLSLGDIPAPSHPGPCGILFFLPDTSLFGHCLFPHQPESQGIGNESIWFTTVSPASSRGPGTQQALGTFLQNVRTMPL